MFSVDYATLEQIIHQFMYTGTFRASVIKSRLLSEDGYIELQVKEGVVVACHYVTRQGKRHVWEQWNRDLGKFGVLNWEQTAQTTQPLRLAPPSEPTPRPSFIPAQANSRSPIPFHTLAPNVPRMQQLPLLYRQVYHLVDGKRQFSTIALLLRKSEEEVALVINELIRQGLVGLE